MKKLLFIGLLLTGLIALSPGCERDIKIFKEEVVLNLPAENFDYIDADYINSSSEFSSDVPTMLRNSGVTNEGAKLGRVLFYDTRLSLNNRVSCASCHDQKSAFADDKAFSIGFENKETPRNSMAIVNPIMNNSLFWDSRAHSIEKLVGEPIQNHIEMGMESMDDLVLKIQNIDYYQPLFEEAYGPSEISEFTISDALSQFLRSMVSSNAKFDIAAANDFSSFSELEKKGRDIFFSPQANCSSCHSGINFSAPDGVNTFNRSSNSFIEANSTSFNVNEYAGPDIQGTANIGLDVVYADNGFRDGQFKIPTLRNIELTGPYMHDGRYETLEEVVDHYSSNIQLHENLDDKFIEGGSVKHLNLNQHDKDALVAFLKTLTDEKFVNAERFSDPFGR